MLCLKGTISAAAGVVPFALGRACGAKINKCIDNYFYLFYNYHINFVAGFPVEVCMDILLCILIALVLFVMVFSLRKQKDVLSDFDNRIKILESFNAKLDHSEEV